MRPMTERVQFVDENDNPIGAGPREEAWEKGIALRHAYIVLRDKDGNFLLQQRSQLKKKNPGRYTYAATGHVDEGESYDEAAVRELKEEVGIDANLTLIDKSSYMSDEVNAQVFIAIYSGEIDHDVQLILDPEEVSGTRWFTKAELDEAVSKTPESFSPNMVKTYKKIFL